MFRTARIQLLAGLLSAVFLFCNAAPAAANAPAPLPVRAKAYLVKKDGAQLWSHQAATRLPPASLTKIMTALLAIEQGNLDRIVTVSPAAAAETGSRAGLRAGDRLTLRDLLNAMLIKSANDAAHAVAEAVAGSTEAFIERMNVRAALLGMRDTHYSDVAGHDHPDHYTSARDLALVAEEAMRQPVFRSIVSTEEMTIRTVDNSRTFRLRNSNRLIGTMPEVTGVKTGFTQGAGRCLVAMAERNACEVLLVLLNDRQRWSDAPRLFEEAFDSDGSHRPATIVAPPPKARSRAPSFNEEEL